MTIFMALCRSVVGGCSDRADGTLGELLGETMRCRLGRESCVCPLCLPTHHFCWKKSLARGDGSKVNTGCLGSGPTTWMDGWQSGHTGSVMQPDLSTAWLMAKLLPWKLASTSLSYCLECNGKRLA